jgi:hypothetical protein
MRYKSLNLTSFRLLSFRNFSRLVLFLLGFS